VKDLNKNEDYRYATILQKCIIKSEIQNVVTFDTNNYLTIKFFKLSAMEQTETFKIKEAYS